MENNPAMEDGAERKKRNFRKYYLFIGIILFLVVIFTVVFIFFRGNALDKSSLLNRVSEKDSEAVTLKEDYDEPKLDDVSFDRDLLIEAGSSIPDSFLDSAQNFLSRNLNIKKESVFSNYDLLENEILLEVISKVKLRYGDAVTYKVIASENPSFIYKVGDEFSFEPIIDDRSMIIKKGNSDIIYASDSLDYRIPKILDEGDKIAFKCFFEDCEDWVLDWVLVFRED